MQVLKNVQTKTQAAQRTIFVNELTDGLPDPAVPTLGPVADGGIIVANTAPGCWGRGSGDVPRPAQGAGRM